MKIWLADPVPRAGSGTSLTHDVGEVRRSAAGTASIARGQFLPGLGEAGSGRPILVGSREAELPVAQAPEALQTASGLR